MKKTLVLLLILAVAGGVFAQELTWSGAVGTGVKIQAGDSFDDPIVNADADDDDSSVLAKIGLTATWDNWGLKIGTKAEAVGSGDTNNDGIPENQAGQADGFVNVYNAYGWFDVLDKMINIKAGKIDDAVWSTGGDQDWNISNGMGVRFEVKPIEGLNVGAFLGYGTTSNHLWANGGMKVADFFQETAIGFAYAADAFSVSGGVRLDSENDGLHDYAADGPGDDDQTTYTDDKNKPLDLNSDLTVLFGFGFTGVENLTIKVEAAAWNLIAWGDAGSIRANETFEYQISEALKAGIVLTEQFWGMDLKDYSAFYLRFKPYAEYGLNETMTVGIGIPVVINNGFKALEVNPWFKYTFSENANFKIGYTAIYTNEIKADDATILYPTAGDSMLNHKILATFGWSF